MAERKYELFCPQGAKQDAHEACGGSFFIDSTNSASARPPRRPRPDETNSTGRLVAVRVGDGCSASERDAEKARGDHTGDGQEAAGQSSCPGAVATSRVVPVS